MQNEEVAKVIFLANNLKLGCGGNRFVCVYTSNCTEGTVAILMTRTVQFYQQVSICFKYVCYRLTVTAAKPYSLRIAASIYSYITVWTARISPTTCALATLEWVIR